ncbi:MAG: DUF6125 family protein [Dehalococcoidia bacterium]
MVTLEHLSHLPREKLLQLLEDAYKNLTRVDGYYFMEIEKLAGAETAVRCDEAVWQRFGRVEAFQIRRNFELEGDGIPTLVQALRLSLIWPTFSQYQVEQLSPSEAVFRVTHCASQANRLNEGLGLFSCQGVEQSYFSSFAAGINPHIKVSCMSCPPENYSPDLWCQWRFELSEASEQP